MTGRPKIAIYWLGACGGCDSSLIDLGESLLQLAAQAEIVIWPVALDFKHDRLRKIPDRSVDLAVISGCVRNSDHREMAVLLRKKSRLLLACGACACFGGVPGLANLRPAGDITEWVYHAAPTVDNPSGTEPEQLSVANGAELRLPEFYDHVYSLNQLVAVDYYLPGCPPPSDLLLKAISGVLAARPPRRGSTLAPGKALCDSCPRNHSKPLRLEIRSLRRCHEVAIDPADCFLNHGVICMGPATRDGCGGTCLKTNTPCRGCFGPVEGVRDAGLRFLSSLATILSPADEQELRALADSLADPAGYACRFTQAVSILGERKIPEDKE
jgi:F420-non-reducing hydrogenase small subunit